MNLNFIELLTMFATETTLMATISNHKQKIAAKYILFSGFDT